MIVRNALVLCGLSVYQAFAINCHTCGDRNLFGAMIDPVLRQLGAINLIDKRGECNNTAQVCVSTAYCYKRIDYYEPRHGGFGVSAEFWEKRCDLPPGQSAATQPGKCIEYDKSENSMYRVTRKMCVCNDREFCNGGPTTSFSVLISCIVMALVALVFN